MTCHNFEFKELPKHFRVEEKALKKMGIINWEKLIELKDIEITKLANTEKCSMVNLKKLRGIAKLICQLSIPMEKAALLIYAGIPTSTALAKYSPQEVISRTNRFERTLSTGRDPLLNLKEASRLISIARTRQI